MTEEQDAQAKKKILVVDDEVRFARLIRTALTAAGYEVALAHDGTEALQRLAAERFALVLSDIQMPGMDGIRLLKEVKRTNPAAEVILMTAFATAENAVEALRSGVRDYLMKPFDMDELRSKVKEAVGAGTSDLEEGPLPGFSAMVGTSEAMQQIASLIAQVAKTDATVLLRGETGTGKGLAARAIHHESPRAGRPFVEIHCAALPETLLESELFGHERGAFTGADDRKIGQLEAADGGTVFLDEIGDVPPQVQVKLLRFLQQREFVPVGGTEVKRVDTRIIAATNRDLEAALKSGAFREDLFYRLDVFPIELPPLRDRAEDVPLLVRSIMERFGKSERDVTDAAMQILKTRDWPGNVRQLENVLERARIVCGEGPIDAEHLAPSPRRPSMPNGSSTRLSLEANERQMIEDALKTADGNKTKAAELLGITRRRLYSRLKVLGIDA